MFVCHDFQNKGQIKPFAVGFRYLVQTGFSFYERI